MIFCMGTQMPNPFLDAFTTCNVSFALGSLRVNFHLLLAYKKKICLLFVACKTQNLVDSFLSGI